MGTRDRWIRRQWLSTAAATAANGAIDDYWRDVMDPERPWDYAPFWDDDGLYDPDDEMPSTTGA